MNTCVQTWSVDFCIPFSFFKTTQTQTPDTEGMYWFHSKCSYAFEVLSRVKSMFDPHCKGNQTESIGKWNVVQKRSPITWLQSFERSLSHLIVWKQSISARLCFHLWHITSAETGTKDAKDQTIEGITSNYTISIHFWVYKTIFCLKSYGQSEPA